ncbi:proteasome component [Ophiostoma piceae UAMH 11346]|uniref:Proteasome component n=1 Tax=Ophiostoma piceae (strain UAMH 11346) TaxID=1262450 RepID=S3BZY1_OPHP1|nr:proteasome component [Ophiostoma piceae UAMH 11346]
MMATPPTEQRELELVEKVDFRILNVANNEKKLQDLLAKFLVPLLLKGSSEYASVRAKVATIAQRLKLFIQPPGIVLPVAALVQQFKSTDSAVVRHLDISFIQHSIGRIAPKDRRELLPALFRGISAVNSATPALFDIILQTLAVLKLPPRGSKEDDAFAVDIGLDDAADAAYVAERFGKIFLLSRGRSSSGSLASTADDAFFLYDQESSWLRTGTNLADTRIRVANFLASGAFAANLADRFLPALYAAAHTDSRASSIGEDLLKRTKVSLETKELVDQLYAAHAVLPAAHRIRILGLLSRSVLAASYDADILNVVQSNLDAPETPAAGGQSTSRSRGLEMAKLHKALFEFINWVARVGPTGTIGTKDKSEKKDATEKTEKTDQDTSFKIGRQLIDFLRSYIDNLGWPVPTVTGIDYESLRAKAYETIGMLAKGARMTVDERLALAIWLFRSLTEDPTTEVVVNVDGALSSMSAVFAPNKSHPDSKAEERAYIVPRLHAVLLRYMELDENDEAEPLILRSARHAVAKWANNCFAFSDPIARWLNVLAAAGRRGERSDVVEEGHKGLDPWTYYSNNVGREHAVDLPQWPELVRFFFKTNIASHVKAVVAEAEGKPEPASTGMDVDEISSFVNFPDDKVDAYPLSVKYCRRILFLTALKDQFKVEPGWEQQVETLVESDKKTRDTIRAYLKENPSGLVDLLTASFEGMLMEKPTIAEPCGRSFVDIASLAPRSALASLSGRAPELLALVKSNKKEIRKLAASAVGILGAHPDNSEESILKLKADLVEASKPWKAAVGSELNATEGAFVALAHLLSRLVFYNSQDTAVFTSDAASLFPTTDEIVGASASFRDALFDSFSQLWMAGIECLPGVSADATADEKIKTTLALIDALSTQAKKGNERAIAALGRLALAIGSDSSSETPETSEKSPAESDITELILTKLYALYEIKQAEVHFSIGGAITAAVACWDADVVELSLDVEQTDSLLLGAAFHIPKRPNRLSATLNKILTDCKTTKPSLLKASGIWLFSLIQHGSHLPEVQSQLRACQVAFMRLLSARDELVQETASRGLALVYEKGDPSLKGDLVKDLVSSFTGSGPKLEVDEETELFDAGALPTGEGNKSVTSYKDIVNLANEVGDQTLIYKFMSLAANAATWSTRSAFGRFGLSNILSDSESTVDPKLYPKLYRYRFDPNPNVQRSMNDIWKALVKDSSATIEAHFDAIMQDLLKSVLGKEWRVREASAAAIADLVQGRPFVQYEKYYEEVWARALKVLDDVKGSVREAALRLCITLSNTLVRQLEESGGATGEGSRNATAMMNEALPFLMSDKGIESGVEDVKVFATITVLKIAKHGGKSLRPYIAAMVPHLLGLLSTIEPQAFNYYYMRSGDDDKEKLDKMRSAMVSQSPISEAIENSLRNVDATVLTDLAPGIEAAMKSAVGMPTKIGCGRVLTTLATRHTLDFAPHAARFLQLLEKQALGDRNDEVSQSYAKTAAYVLRAAPDAAREKYATRLVDAYFAAEDEARRQKVADAVLAISKISPDHFNALENKLLPFVYVGMHDESADHDYVHKACAEVWNKHAGSTGLVVSRYVPEIAALVQRSLDTAQWALKHAGARTAAAAVGAVLSASDLSGSVNEPNLRILWPLYEKALALKTFEGKEKLLDALPDFVTKAKVLWQADAKMAAALRKIATVEAKRNNDAYRVYAFRCLGKVAAAREDVEMWPDVVTIVTPHLEALKEFDEKQANEMDIDSGNNKKKDGAAAQLEKRVRETAENGLEAVVKGYYRPALAKNPGSVLASVWTAVGSFVTSDAYILSRRTVWYKAIYELLDAAAEAAAALESTEITLEGSADELVLSYLQSLDVDRPEAGTEEQRSNRAKALKALAKTVKKGAFGKDVSRAKTAAAIEGALSTERSLDVQKLLKEALAETK